MNDRADCSKCGAPLSADARWGFCPKCLLDPQARATKGAKDPFNSRNNPSDRQIGDYQLVRQIGRGGMGVVYEAIQVSLHRPVAMKWILDDGATSLAGRRRFAIEAEAAAMLDHPNIVPIYEVGEYDDHPFLSMKLVQGQSLKQKIVSGELGLSAGEASTNRSAWRNRQQAVARLMATIAHAVQHAHEKGVLHRDLKPGNILMDAEGQPHLTDFGLAKIFAPDEGDGASVEGTRSSAILGTPGYMSPEQASSERLTQTTDVYGLGAILYELLTGQPPFKGHTALETIRLVTEQEPKRPRSVLPDLDADLDTICMKCLEKDPDARYGSAQALAEDLERWLRQETIRARPAGPGLRLRRWVKRNPVGTALIASLCVSLGVSLVMLRLSADKARIVIEQMERIEIERVLASNRLTRELDDIWRQTNRTGVLISPQDLAALDNRSPHLLKTNDIPLTFALTINDNPVNLAIAYAPFLYELESRMTRTLGRQVFLSLQLYKAGSWASLLGERDEADVQRMSYLTYVRLRQTDPAITPLAQDRMSAEFVIFARAGLGVTNLAQAAGRTALFAHTNSVGSFLAKVCLAQAGICATNFKFIKNLGSPVFGTPPVPESRDASDEDIENYAHKAVIEKVLNGEYAIGVAPKRHFDKKNRGRGILVELAKFSSPPDVYVAKSGLDPNIMRVFQASLVSLRDKAMLGKMRRYMIHGLEPITDGDFDKFRGLITNEWVFFKTGRWPSASGRSEALDAKGWGTLNPR